MKLVPSDGTELISQTTPRFKTPIKLLYASALDSKGRPNPRAAERPTVIFFYGNGAYDYVIGKRGTRPENIIPTGWSLGSGVTVNLAAKLWIIPAPLLRAIMWFRFPNEDRIRHVRCPIFIAHGEDDDIAPIYMARKLARAARTPVTFLPLKGVGHGNTFESRDEPIYPPIGRWIAGLH